MLFRILAHDLLTPLQNLSTTTEILPKLVKDRKDQDIQIVLESICESATALQSSMFSIFSWSGNDESFFKDNFCEITERIKIITSSYKSYANQKKIVFNTVIEQKFIVQGSGFYWDLLLRNLINNAIKHGRFNSVAFVKVYSQNQEIIIEINNSFNNPEFLQEKELKCFGENFYCSPTWKNGYGSKLIKEAIVVLNCKVFVHLQHNLFSVKILSKKI